MEKKKTGGAAEKIIAVTTALSLLTGGLFTDSAKLPEDELPKEIVPITEVYIPESEPVPEANDTEERKRRQTAVPFRRRVLISIGAVILYILLMWAVTMLTAALPAAAAFAIKLAAGAAAVFLMYIGAMKLIHPDKSIKELVKGKALRRGLIITGLAAAGIFIIKLAAGNGGEADFFAASAGAVCLAGGLAALIRKA